MQFMFELASLLVLHVLSAGFIFIWVKFSSAICLPSRYCSLVDSQYPAEQGVGF